jgi:two-component system, OmpR family, sensor histidine kinase KdpD
MPNAVSMDSHTANRRIRYLAAVVVVALCSLLAWISHLTEANIVMIFLAGVAIVAARQGRGPAVLAAVLSVLVFDYFFVKPRFSFVIDDAQYFITLAVMLGIGVLISQLTARLQAQLEDTKRRERRSAELYHVTRTLNESSRTDDLIRKAGEFLKQVFDGDAVVYLSDSANSLELKFGVETALANDPNSVQAARQVFEKAGTPSGPTGGELLIRREAFVPMRGHSRIVGVLGVRPRDADRFGDAEERRMLNTCAGLIALSLERDQSIAQAYEAQLEVQRTQLQVHSEQLRNSLLNSISHDLRTPLSTIAVTASTLLDESINTDEAARRDGLQTVVDESRRLGRQVENLLEMARLNSGVIRANAEWEAVEELVEASLARLHRELEGRTIRVQIDKDVPPLWVAGELMEKVFVNLLENASRYARPDSVIEITGVNRGEHVEIVVADDGPGLPPGTEAKVFEKYFRGRSAVDDGQRGIGLGLAICRTIIEAHGGRIRAANRASGGAEFTISMPCEQLDASEHLVHSSAEMG